MFFVSLFFKQKMAYEMRISDWSSDVCSSDLVEVRIKRAIAGVKATDHYDVGVPAGPGQILSGPGLYEPRLKRTPIPRETDRTRRMSPRGEALMRLQRRARSARIVMSADVRAYLHPTMGDRKSTRLKSSH